MENIDNKNSDKMQVLLNKITELYIANIIIIFPLCIDATGFFRILECKYRCFLWISVIYLAIIIIINLYYFIFYKINGIKNKMTKVQHALIIFWAINIVSCIISPYFDKYNLFVGVGRGEGLITISLYCLTFLAITLFGKFEKRMVLYFSISSICLNLVCILQYIGFNPLNMYQEGIGTHNVSFMGTIGNIDFISAIYCMLLTVSFSAFVILDEKKIYKIVHLLSVFMGFFIFVIINVMSGTVAFIATFILLFPFIITNSKYLSRTLIAIDMIILGMIINIIINPEYHYDIGKLGLYFQFNKTALALIIIFGIFMVLAYILKNMKFTINPKSKIIKKMYVTMLILAILAIIGLYFINFNHGMLHQVHQILHGNLDDTFGTYRMFLWKRTVCLLNEYTLLGTGPDTFAVRFMDKYTQDVANLRRTFNK